MRSGLISFGVLPENMEPSSLHDRTHPVHRPLYCFRPIMRWMRHLNGGYGLWLSFLLGLFFSFMHDTASGQFQGRSSGTAFDTGIVVGAERTELYLALLQGKRIAVVTNHTGTIKGRSLVDTLLALHVSVVKVFAPEHGFRGDLDAGETVSDGRDPITGIPVISLYGEHKKPEKEQLKDVDLLLFDIQDVGVRFYTYISTLHYVMEAAAESKEPVIVLDRPDPNGFYVDGPVLDTAYASFVGLHPIPIVHGMTIGEYARMINGEGWLKGGIRCELTVVPCKGYDHTKFYELPVPPSPNLPNMSAVYLYPSLGLFEGTVVSVGRGTDRPFQCIGWPQGTLGSYRFTPRSLAGARSPPYKDVECRGMDLREFGSFYMRLTRRLYLQWLLGMYSSGNGEGFFQPYFDRLAGGPALRRCIEKGMDEEAIRATWKKDLDRFMLIRTRYLLYQDFQ